MESDKRARKHEQHKLYYAKTAFKYESRKWTVAEDKLVLAHEIPDRELSRKIERSMKAISNRRWRLKRADCAQEKPVTVQQIQIEGRADMETTADVKSG